jgi:hypothetical protein
MGITHKIYAKNPDIVFRKIANEYILVPVRNKMGNLESIYTLNEVAARVWELIDGKRETQEIREIITQEFDANNEEVGKDMVELIKQLEGIEGIKAAE